jgi:hypothetical protein
MNEIKIGNTRIVIKSQLIMMTSEREANGIAKKRKKEIRY